MDVQINQINLDLALAPEPDSTRVQLNKPVFLSSAFFILIMVVIINVYPDTSSAWLNAMQGKLAHGFGWYYMLVVAAYLIFIIGLACSPYGKIKLGTDDSTPDFSYGAWAGMLFSSGIGISLLYFGASEAMTHYLLPPNGITGTPEAAGQAVMLTFLHWGIHGWAIYALMAVALGYFSYRFQRPLALRTALYPLLGDRIQGVSGHIVDCFGIIVTVFGLVSNLGIGTLQINAGLTFLFGINNSYSVLVIVMIIMTTVATLAAISGIEVGIRRLSNLNIWLFAFLLLYVLTVGPGLQLLNQFVQNIGDYTSNLIHKSFDLYAYSATTNEWVGKWTLFYWAWWIAWAPFVGLFVARISRGRTIREVVIGVLFLPLGFTTLWLSVFGNSALDLLINHGATELGNTALNEPAMAIYQLLSYYPMSKFIIGVAVFVGFVLFLTPADSGAVMLANLSVKGRSESDAPNWLRIFWSLVILAMTAGLMYFNNISALQTSIVLTSLPFSIILILYMICLIKGLRQENCN